MTTKMTTNQTEQMAQMIRQQARIIRLQLADVGITTTEEQSLELALRALAAERALRQLEAVR